MTTSIDITTLSFEAALRELEEIVKKLENAQVSLEESMALYERGAALRSHAEQKLIEAEGRIAQISLNAQGQPQATPIDINTTNA